MNMLPTPLPWILSIPICPGESPPLPIKEDALEKHNGPHYGR